MKRTATTINLPEFNGTFADNLIRCLLYLRGESQKHEFPQTSQALLQMIDVVAREAAEVESISLDIKGSRAVRISL